MAWFFGILSLILSILVVVMGYYLWKFLRIIMVFEDDLKEAIEALQEVERSMGRINDLRLFFDDEEVRGAADEIKNTFRLAQYYVNQVIINFTRRSKQKYIVIIEEEAEGEEGGMRTPLPREGTIAHVGRPETEANKKEKI